MINHSQQQVKVDFGILVGKYRQMLMGLMILWIVFLHMHIAFPITMWGQGLRFFQGCGILAVDIFFLLSGFGLCFSKSGPNIFRFFKKRVFRVLPAYWVVIGIETILLILANNGISIGRFFRLFLGLEFPLTGNLDYWFVSAIIICYMLFPFINHILGKKNLLKNAAGAISICLLIGILISFSGICSYLLVFILRIPSFILGIVLGKFVFEKKQVFFSSKQMGAIIILLFLGFLSYGAVGRWASSYFKWNLGLYWYPGIIASLPCCFLLAIFCDFVNNRVRMFCSIIAFIGKYTLEIYLVNGLLVNGMKIDILHKNVIAMANNSYLSVEFIIAMVSILFGVILAMGIRGIVQIVPHHPVRRIS
jgi:peptidoglycan/LPS O-acetylase OafA/YrhL